MNKPTLLATQRQRTSDLHQLATDDPVAWAICTGVRGLYTIAGRILRQTEDVQAELDRLIAAGEIRRTRHKGRVTYQPKSLRMIRLSKRAAVIKFKLMAEYQQSIG